MSSVSNGGSVRYGTIVADPPWHLELFARSQRLIHNPEAPYCSQASVPASSPEASERGADLARPSDGASRPDPRSETSDPASHPYPQGYPDHLTADAHDWEPPPEQNQERKP